MNIPGGMTPKSNLSYGILEIYKWILIISIVLSWIRVDPYNPIVRILNSLTEPVFSRARKLLPFLRAGMMDFSPIAVFIAIMIIQHMLRRF